MTHCKYPDCKKPVKVSGYCGPHYSAQRTAQLSLVEARQEDKSPPPIEGWHCVYVIGCPELVPIKVGRSTNVINRISQVQGGCPYMLRLHEAFFAPPNVVKWLEWDVKRKLHDFDLGTKEHLNTEWFLVAPEDAVAVIRKCAELKDFRIYSAQEFEQVAMTQKGEVRPEWIEHIGTINFMANGITPVR